MGPVAAFSSRVETLWPFANVGRARWAGRGRSKRHSRTGVARGGWVVWWMGQAPQTGDGRPSEGATELGFPGPALGNKVRRRALRVSRPAREKKRRRRVLVVTTCWPRPMRAVQRLWAITWTASQAALAAKRLGEMVEANLRSLMAFSISAWRRWSASSQGIPLPVGDEAMIAVAVPVGSRAWASPYGR